MGPVESPRVPLRAPKCIPRTPSLAQGPPNPPLGPLCPFWRPPTLPGDPHIVQGTLNSILGTTNPAWGPRNTPEPPLPIWAPRCPRALPLSPPRGGSLTLPPPSAGSPRGAARGADERDHPRPGVEAAAPPERRLDGVPAAVPARCAGGAAGSAGGIGSSRWDWALGALGWALGAMGWGSGRPGPLGWGSGSTGGPGGGSRLPCALTPPPPVENHSEEEPPDELSFPAGTLNTTLGRLQPHARYRLALRALSRVGPGAPVLRLGSLRPEPGACPGTAGGRSGTAGGGARNCLETTTGSMRPLRGDPKATMEGPGNATLRSPPQLPP